MKNLSFNRRVALNFMGATAIMMLLIYLTIYAVVYRTVYNHMNNDLLAEARELREGLTVQNDSLFITSQREWREPEHGLLEINPIFIQVSRPHGLVKKSPNLGQDKLYVRPSLTEIRYFKDTIKSKPIYQLQFPVTDASGQKKGDILVAVPLKDTQMVLVNLRTVLILSFPIIIVLLFFITNYIAGRSIAPVNNLMREAGNITGKNYTHRLPLPKRKDELYYLTKSINDLIARLQEAIQREKQFTSDASHELRTPLSSMKGVLEVALRKSRNQEYYHDKLYILLDEVNKMSTLSEQLLWLARYEQGNQNIKQEKFSLLEILHQQYELLEDELHKKSLYLNLEFCKDIDIMTDWMMLNRIIQNILTNAIKFSPENTEITVKTFTKEKHAAIEISDHGDGIDPQELDKIFDRFYQADNSRSAQTGGSGLGLSIVKRFTDLLGIAIQAKSRKGEGTSFILEIPLTDQASRI
ncbi:MAG: HAMP domain-containing protein [Bacteroidales bacterium]|nr:HAMP domain-containing protein [Bacteroidales bacterium]MCF8333556.1 HAMP domain-containing protein [Bacteroidales bacterium]